MVAQLSKIDEIISRCGGEKSALIQIMLEVQKEYRWLPEEALAQVGKELDIPLSQIYHIATFYKAFSLEPRGRHSLAVCLGTACQVRGAPRLLDKVVDILKVKPGGTSKDLKFSLDTVNCLGCCALGPVLMMDGTVYSVPTTKEIEKLVDTAE
ncbi:MAG TPA: NAD(P)H-dependent oxidoreductase subunit E [Dehalococcoidales bacterium]|jgi:NADH-quinone oxidoreductase subunit E